MEARTQPATVTVRINHTRTQKAGWQHETTVTFSGALTWTHDGYVTYDTGREPLGLGAMMTELLDEMDFVGRTESARRNALDQEGAE